MKLGPISDEVRAALDQVPCGVLQTSEDGTLRRANRTFCESLGFEESELVGERRLQDLLTVGSRIFHHTHWAPLMHMQGAIAEIKLELVHRDGSSVPMVLNAARHEVDGTAVYDIAAYVARDRDRYEQELVLARKRLEEAVAEANRLQAEARDRALFAEQMVGIVSHDLRNPLSTIMMGTAALVRSDVPPAQRRVASTIIRATDRANRLIADLLDFTQARVGSGLSVTRAPVDLHQLAADTLEEQRVAHSERSFVHIIAGPGECSIDADRIGQLIGNLIANAIAYGQRDTPITVATKGEGDRVAVSVHNEGPPIPPPVLTGLFQPMTRGTKAGGEARSVGLGLFIVSEIARAHGGSATVASSAGDGTTFTAAFPRG